MFWCQGPQEGVLKRLAQIISGTIYNRTREEVHAILSSSKVPWPDFSGDQNPFRRSPRHFVCWNLLLGIPFFRTQNTHLLKHCGEPKHWFAGRSLWPSGPTINAIVCVKGFENVLQKSQPQSRSMVAKTAATSALLISSWVVAGVYTCFFRSVKNKVCLDDADDGIGHCESHESHEAGSARLMFHDTRAATRMVFIHWTRLCLLLLLFDTAVASANLQRSWYLFFGHHWLNAWTSTCKFTTRSSHPVNSHNPLCSFVGVGFVLYDLHVFAPVAVQPINKCDQFPAWFLPIGKPIVFSTTPWPNRTYIKLNFAFTCVHDVFVNACFNQTCKQKLLYGGWATRDTWTIWSSYQE